MRRDNDDILKQMKTLQDQQTAINTQITNTKSDRIREKATAELKTVSDAIEKLSG